MLTDTRDDIQKAFDNGYKVGLSGTISTTFPAYPPVKEEVRKAWMAGWKKGQLCLPDKSET